MERIIKCPNCGAEVVETYYTESPYGECEYHFHCEKCGLFRDFAYGVLEDGFYKGDDSNEELPHEETEP